MTTILAIDPAAERVESDTGWFLGSYSDTKPLTRISGGTVRGGFLGFCYWINTEGKRDLLSTDVVVCEQYKVFNRAGDPTPLLIEGVVRYRRPDVVLQPSSGKNTAVPDDVLRRSGLWSSEGHHHDAREAARHALLCLFRAKHAPTLRAYWG